MAAPKTMMNLFSLTDIGRRLTDPGPAYEALQMIFGWQVIVGTAALPGPLASMAVNVIHGPALGTGNDLSVQLPYALAGRVLKIVNISGSTVMPTVQPYNPANERPDVLVWSGGGLPIPIGIVAEFLSYEPGFWLLANVDTTPVPPEE